MYKQAFINFLVLTAAIVVAFYIDDQRKANEERKAAQMAAIANSQLQA